MSSFGGKRTDDNVAIDLAMLRQLKEAELQGLDLTIYLVDNDGFLIVDEDGNFILNE